MKKFILMLAAIAALTMSAEAQTYGVQTLGSFMAQGAAATNVAYVVDVRKQSTVTLQWDRISSGAGAQVISLAFSRSTDGSTYNSALDSLTLASGGATATTTVTNIPTYGAGYIKIHYMTNANADTVFTTNTLKYAVKIGAP